LNQYEYCAALTKEKKIDNLATTRMVDRATIGNQQSSGNLPESNGLVDIDLVLHTPSCLFSVFICFPPIFPALFCFSFLA